MKPSMSERPVSGTYFEVAQLLRPRPKIRPVSAPCGSMHRDFDTSTPEGDRWSGNTAVERPETTCLYTSRAQYEVANSQVLGSLSRHGGGVEAHALDSHFSPLSPREMIRCAKALLSPRLSSLPEKSEGEKVHGTFCRTKSVMKDGLRRGRRHGTVALGSRDSLRLGYLSASTDNSASKEKAEDSEQSNAPTVSDDPLQIPPLRPVSKFMPALTISIPENEFSSCVAVDHHKIEDEGEMLDEKEDNDSFAATLSSTHSSVLVARLNNEHAPSETAFCKIRDEDDVFALSTETSQLDRQENGFMTKLRATISPDPGHQITSIAGVVSSESKESIPSPKLRHKALQKTSGSHQNSLRAQFTAFESPLSPRPSDVPKVWTMNETEMNKTVRLAPSLEHGLKANDLEIFEENAMAAATPVVRGIKPDVVDVRETRVFESITLQNQAVLDRETPSSRPAGQSIRTDMFSIRPCTTLSAASHVATPGTSPAAPLSAASEPSRPDSSGSATARAMPLQILEIIVFSAAYGDAECRVLASDWYIELMDDSVACTTPQLDARGQRLLLQSHLIHELESLVQLGFLPRKIFNTVRGQLFPTRNTLVMGNRQFTAYIHRAVGASHMNEYWAKEVLELVIGDESFAQCSPEEEVFFERQPFNSEGFIYGDNASVGPYDCFDSMRSTVGTFESEEPQPQPGWRSSLWSRIIAFFRPGHGMRKV